VSREDIWTELEKMFPIDKDVFEKILHIREGVKEAKSYALDELFDRFLATLQNIVAWVDKF
jgi:hypothetical protein